MRVIYVAPGLPAKEMVVTGWDEMREILGGNLEPYEVNPEVVILAREEAYGLPVNRAILSEEDRSIENVIIGPFFLCGDREREITDLPEKYIGRYLEEYRYPDIMIRDASRAIRVFRNGSCIGVI